VASTHAPAPQGKGKRVLVIPSDSEDSDGGLVFKKRRATRDPTPPTAFPGGVDSLRDNTPSATSPPPQTVQEERGDGAESALPPLLTETPTASVSAPAAPILSCN